MPAFTRQAAQLAGVLNQPVGATTNPFAALGALSQLEAQSEAPMDSLQSSASVPTANNLSSTNVTDSHSSDSSHSSASDEIKEQQNTNPRQLTFAEEINTTLLALESKIAIFEQQMLQSLKQGKLLDTPASYNQTIEQYYCLLSFANVQLTSTRYSFWLKMQQLRSQKNDSSLLDHNVASTSTTASIPLTSTVSAASIPFASTLTTSIPLATVQQQPVAANGVNLTASDSNDDGDDVPETVSMPFQEQQLSLPLDQGSYPSAHVDSSISSLPGTTVSTVDSATLFDHIIQINDGKGLLRCGDNEMKQLPRFKPTALTVFFLNFERAVFSMNLPASKLATILWMLLDKEIHTRKVVGDLMLLRKSWGDVKKAVREQYTRVDERSQAINELMKYHMRPGSSFNEYRAQFQVLVDAASVNLNAPTTIAQFVDRLAEPLNSAAIRDFISQGVYPELHQRYNFNTLCQYLHQLEQFLQAKTPKTHSMRTPHAMTKPASDQNKYCVHHPNSTSHNTSECLQAKMKGNSAATNTLSSTVPIKATSTANNNAQAVKHTHTNKQRTPLCYMCGEVGHYVTDCSNPANPNKVKAAIERMKQARAQKHSSGQSN